MRVLAFAASVRQSSLNRRLIRLACEIGRHHGAEIDLAQFHEFDMPLYDGDQDARSGLPDGAKALERRIRAADALLLATPEYNYSIPGTLKNAIDWVSRARPMPWRGKSVYLMSASPGAVGGIRGLWQTRIPLEGCGAIVFPDMFALSHANEAFDAEGRLRDPLMAQKLEREVLGFVRFAEALVPICARAAEAPPRKPQREIVEALEEETQLQPS